MAKKKPSLPAAPKSEALQKVEDAVAFYQEVRSLVGFHYPDIDPDMIVNIIVMKGR